MNFEDLKKQALLFVYWCNKLREGGFIEGGPVITEKGFDSAMDLVESGVKLDEKIAINSLVLGVIVSLFTITLFTSYLA